MIAANGPPSRGWSQPKVFKIENGRTMPTVADLVGRFEELATQVTGWRVLLRSGIVGSQRRVAELDQRSAVSWQLTAAGVPGLLQTAEYARSVLGKGQDPTADFAAGMAARLDRQQVLHAPGKVFHFLLIEDLVRRLVADPQVMAV